MAKAKRIIYNGNLNTSVDYIPLVDNVVKYAYVNGIKIPHWTSQTYPAAPMTSNSSQNCVITTSGNYSTSSTYAPWRAFDSDKTGTAWASAQDQNVVWIMIKLPKPLKNITVHITNRIHSSGYVNGIGACQVQGSDNGSSFTTISTFNGNTSTGGRSYIHNCANYNDAYQYIRLYITDWGNKTASSSNYCAIGDIYFTGKVAT